MEKRGIVEEGITPPEGNEKTAEDLDNDLRARLAFASRPEHVDASLREYNEQLAKQ